MPQFASQFAPQFAPKPRFTMRQLIIMRHGKAETATGSGDHARPLSPRGRAEAAEAGRRLAALAGSGVARPVLALVSDSARTRQTFDCLAPALDPAPAATFTRSIYGVTAEAVLAAVRALPDGAGDAEGAGEAPGEAGSALLVGHNPAFGDLARRLAGTGDPQDLAALARGFPTSCFAVIDLDAGRWGEVGAPGRLRFLLPADEREGS